MKLSTTLLPLLAVIFAASDAILAATPPALEGRALPAVPSGFQHVRRARGGLGGGHMPGAADLHRRAPLIGALAQGLDDLASGGGTSSSDKSDGQDTNTSKPLPTGSTSDTKQTSDNGGGSSSGSGSGGSSSGSGGGLLGGLGDSLGHAVGSLGGTVNDLGSNVGKTLQDTTGSLGKTVENLTGNLDKTLGTGSGDSNSSGSSSSHSGDSGPSSSTKESATGTSDSKGTPTTSSPSGSGDSGGGLLGGLGGALGDLTGGLGSALGGVLGAPESAPTPTPTPTSSSGDGGNSTTKDGGGSGGGGSSSGGGLLGGLGDTLGTLVHDVGDTLGGATKGSDSPPAASPTPTPGANSGSGSGSGSNGQEQQSTGNGGLLGGLGDTLDGVTKGLGDVLGGGGDSKTGDQGSSTKDGDATPTPTKQPGLLDPIITPITSVLGGGGNNDNDQGSTKDQNQNPPEPTPTDKVTDEPKTATYGGGNPGDNPEPSSRPAPTAEPEPTRTLDYPTTSPDGYGPGTGVGYTSTVTPTLEPNTSAGTGGGTGGLAGQPSPTPTTPPASTGTDEYWYADSQSLILPLATQIPTTTQDVLDAAATTTAAVPTDPIARYPASIVPPDATSEQPDGTALVSILFKPTMPWIGLVQTPATATQVFAYMPLLLSETSGITAGDVTVVRLTSYYKDSERDINKALSMYQAYIPIAAAQVLRDQVRDTTSLFYTVPNTTVAKQLAANIDPTYDILSSVSIRTSVNNQQHQTAFNGDDKATLRNALIGVGSAFVAAIVAFIGWRIYRRQQKAKKAALLRASRSGGVGAQTIRSFGPAASLRETWAPSVHEQHAVMHGQLAQTWEHEVQNSGPYIDAGYGQSPPQPAHHLDGLDHGNFGDPFGDAFVAPNNRASRETQRTEAGAVMSSARSRTSQMTEAQRIQHDYLESRSVRASVAGVGVPLSPGSAGSRASQVPAGIYQDNYEAPQQYTSSHAYGPRSIDNRRKRNSRASISTSSIGRPEMQSNSMLF